MDKLVKWLENLLRAQKKSRAWRTFVSCLAAIVVFTTTYSLILPAITVETSATEEVGGLVMEEADPGSTGAEAEASGEVVTVDAENEIPEENTAEAEAEEAAPEEEAPAADEVTAPSEDTSSESSAAPAAAPQTETVKPAESTAAVIEEVKEPVNGEVQTIGDSRIMSLTGDDFDVVVSSDLSAGVSDGTVLSVRGVSDAGVAGSFSSRISDELLKIFVDAKTTEAMYQLVFTDENLVEYTPAGNFDVQLIFHNNSVSHSGEMIYAAIYDYLTDEMILAETNGDGTPIVSVDGNGVITGITLKGLNFGEYSDVITLVAGPVNEELKLAAEKAAESGAEKAESTGSKTDSAKSKSEGPAAKAETSKESKASGSSTLTFRGGDYTVTLAYNAEAKIPTGAALEVKEIENGTAAYKKYLEQAKAAMGLDKDQVLPKEQARFFDIKIMADGKEVQPAANVNVNITYDQPVVETDSRVETQIDASAVHFGKDGAEVVEVGDADAKSVKFEAESFSVYGVIYTVDFEYTDPVTGQTYYFSFGGGKSINLTELLVHLGIRNEENVEEFVANEVENVEFSDPELVRVTHNGKILGLFGKEDWKLESLQPFDTEETLTISLKNGEKIVVKVTDAQTADITNQLQNATISGSGSTDEGSTWRIEDTSGTYSIGLNFAESNASDQFPKLTGDEPELHLTYQLPAGLQVHHQNGQATFTNETLGISATIPWELDENGKLTFKLDNTRREYGRKTAYEVFDAAVDAYLNIHVNAQWDGSTEKLRFSSKVEKEVTTEPPTPGTISLQKEGSFIDETQKLHYKVTVNVQDGNVDSAHITDTLQDAYGIKIDRNSVKVTRNIWPFEDVEYTKTVNDQGLEVNFQNLTAGTQYYIEYDADVDYNLLDTDHDGQVDLSPNNTVTDNNTSTETRIIKHVTYTNLDKSVGEESDLIQDGDKYYRELEWTIKVNDKRAADLGGSSLKDTIKSQTPPMEYIGTLTVERTDVNGNKTTSNVAWESLPSFTQSTGWRYDFPAGEDKSSYVFTYKTRVDVTDLRGKGTVKNEVQDKFGNKEQQKQVSPGEEAGVKKEFVSTENGESTWKITLTVPSYGLDLGRVDEQVPSVQKDGRTLYDEVVSYSVDESKLVQGEHFVKEDWNPAESGFTLHFYKDAGTQHPGFQETGEERTIEITVVTKNNEEWLNDSSLTPTHVNTAKLNYMEVKASKDFAKKDIKKTVGVPDYPKTRTIDGKEYQILRYRVELSGVSGSVSIDDAMNIDGVIYETAPNSDYNGSLYFKYYKDWNWYGSQPVTVTQTGNGATFTIADSEIPKQENGDYYGTYAFTYLVDVPVDEIQKMAATSDDLKAIIKNDIDWDGNKVTSDYEVSYDALDKKLLNEGEITGNNRTAKFQIKVNPEGATVNGGEAYLLTDTFSDSLAVNYSSIEFSDPDAVLSYEVSGNTLSIWIEDGKPLTITYNAKVLGEGRIHITNTAETEFDEDKVDTHRDLHGGAEGGGSFPIVHVMKVDGDNAKIRLDGIEFILHSRDQAEEERLNGISVAKRTFITDENGKVDINTHERGYEIYFNTPYYLVENPETIPEHYVPLGNTYETGIGFIIDREGNVDWNIHQYYNGYTLQVKNWKKKGDLEVTKSVVSDSDEDKSKEYSFEIKLYNDQAKQEIAEELTGVFGDVTLEKGTGTFTLTDGQKVEIKGLPEGLYYEVKETDVPEGMTVKYDGQISESATGQIVYNETSKTEVVNTKELPGSLKVKKTSDYTGADQADKVYKLAVKNSDNKFVDQNGDVSDDEVWIEFHANDEKIWNNLKAGSYTVVEEESTAAIPGYKWTAEGTGVSVVVNEGDDKEHTVTNKYEEKSGKVTIPGDKTLTGRDMTAGEFKFIVKEGDEQVATGTNAAAKNGAKGAITFTEITYGPEDIGEHTYVVTESTPDQDGVTQTGTIGFTVKVKVEDIGTDELKATILDTSDSVSFTNEYTTSTTAKIEGKKKYNEDIPEGKFKVQITGDDPLPDPTEAAIGTDGKFAFNDITYPLSVMADVQADPTTGVKTKDFTYTVSEVLPVGVTVVNPVSAEGIKYDTTPKTVTVTVTYNESTGVMSAQVSPNATEFEFENEQLGNLKITKTLKATDPAGDPEKDFEFTITFDGENAEKLGTSYKAIKTKGQESTDLDVPISTVEGNKTATVTLKADESIEIKNLPLGVRYTVTEKDDPDYVVSSQTGDTGTISKDLSEATFENERILGELEVTKTVQLNGNNTDLLGRSFWVAVYSDSDAQTKVAGPQEITIGTDGTGKATFSNLPVGTYYVYELTAEDGTAITGTSGSIDNVEYTITTDNTGAVITKEETKGTASIVNNKTEKGTLTVEKETLYNEKPDETVSGKKIKIGLYDADQSPVQKDGKNWVQELDLSATGTGSVTFSELDYGTYYAYELDDEGNPVKENSGTINGVEYTVAQETKSVELKHGQQTGEIKIVNKTEEEGSLEVTKEIQVNGTTSQALDGTFEVALYKVETAGTAEGDNTGEGGEDAATETLVDHKTITVSKGVSTTVKFEKLEVGATYKVYEVTVDGENVTKVGDQFGQYTVTYENQSVTIPRGTGKDVTGTKVINNIATKEVEVDKKWLNAGGSDITDTIQNAEITVVLKNGETEVTADASGTVINPVTLNGSETPTKWSYKWENLPKYDGNGEEITYSVSETAAKIETDKEGGGTSIIESAVEATADAEGKFHLENTLPKTEIKAVKEWQNENGEPMTGGVYPDGAKVTFEIFAGEAENSVAKVELSGNAGSAPAEDAAAKDSAYESKAWEATFANLPKYDSTGVEITYTIKETVGFTGFENLDPNGVAAGGTIHNKQSSVTLKIVKVDSANNETKLEDAEFTLQEINGDNATIQNIGSPVAKITDENGEASFEKVKFGYYEVAETKTPEGYVLNGDGKFYIKVTAEGYSLLVKESGKAPKEWATAQTQGDVISFTADTANKSVTATVKNAYGAKLPHTGGSGTRMWYFAGLALMAFAACAYVMRRNSLLAEIVKEEGGED